MYIRCFDGIVSEYRLRTGTLVRNGIRKIKDALGWLVVVYKLSRDEIYKFWMKIEDLRRTWKAGATQIFDRKWTRFERRGFAPHLRVVRRKSGNSIIGNKGFAPHLIHGASQL